MTSKDRTISDKCSASVDQDRVSFSTTILDKILKSLSVRLGVESVNKWSST